MTLNLGNTLKTTEEERDSVRSFTAALSAAGAPLRTLACLGVVIVHANLQLRPSMTVWWPAGYWTSCFYSLPVPLFLILSGFGAGGLETRRSSILNFLRRKAHGILFPFFFWNAVLIALALSNQGLSWLEMTALFFTGVWQLYYLFVLLQLLFLKQFLSKRYLPHILATAAVCAAAYYGFADYWRWTRGLGSAAMEVQLNRTIFPWAIYFFTGVWLRQNPQRLAWLAQHKLWLLLVWVISYLAYSGELRLEGAHLGCHPLQQIVLAGLPFQWAGALSLIILFCEMERRCLLRRLRKILAVFGKDSYGVYLSHTTVLTLLLQTYNLHEGSFPYWLEMPLAILLVSVISCGLVRTLRALPWRWPRRLMFGE